MNLKQIIPLLLFCCLAHAASAVVVIPSPGDDDWTNPPVMNSWSFSDTNTWVDFYGDAPVSFTNLSVSNLGDGNAVVVDSQNPAWLQYNVFESSGATNLTVNNGSLTLWFAPHWSSGTNAGATGPGQWGRFIEAGSYTTNASYGWWSLYCDSAGTNIYFSAQTNGADVSYLSAPIAWTTNRWHFIALTYSATNTSLYLDGQLAASGAGMTVWPGSNVLSNGFFVGSDDTGTAQARGMFDDLATYNFPLDTNTINHLYGLQNMPFYLNPANFANVSSAPSQPSTSLDNYNAVTGQGNLQWLGEAAECVTSTNIWITNVVASVESDGTMDLEFTIEGGSDGVAYDVFANSVLDFSSDTNKAWAWMGQGSHCNTYFLSNMPGRNCFLVLGQPVDSDLDGLSDAYERLVSKTDPHNSDTDGDGISDAGEVLLGLNPLVNDNAQSGSRSNYFYDLTDWLNDMSGVRTGSVDLDNEGNVLSVSQ